MAEYKTLRVRITGEVPLLMHNGQLADPTNEWAKRMKQITAKKKKTDSDYEELGRLEWFGSLYLKDGKPCIPAEVIEGTIVTGAKKKRIGNAAKGGVVCMESCTLENGGADLSDLDKLWTEGKHVNKSRVKVQQSTIVRTRPQFFPWACEAVIQFDPSLLNKNDVISALQEAGSMCDWRPKYGRFTAKEI